MSPACLLQTFESVLSTKLIQNWNRDQLMCKKEDSSYVKFKHHECPEITKRFDPSQSFYMDCDRWMEFSGLAVCDSNSALFQPGFPLGGPGRGGAAGPQWAAAAQPVLWRDADRWWPASPLSPSTPGCLQPLFPRYVHLGHEGGAPAGGTQENTVDTTLHDDKCSFLFLFWCVLSVFTYSPKNINYKLFRELGLYMIFIVNEDLTGLKSQLFSI